jgi:hypothetical protein
MLKTRLLSQCIVFYTTVLATASALAQERSPLFTFLLQPAHCAQYLGATGRTGHSGSQAQYAKDLARTINSLRAQGDSIQEALGHVAEFCEVKQERLAYNQAYGVK